MPKSRAVKAPKLIGIIVEAAEAKQAENIKALDVSKTSPVADYLVILSAESEPQVRAIEKEIDKQLRSNKIKGFRWQGVAKSGWIVLDLGDILVHIMRAEERTYYNLEELWENDAVTYHY